MDPDELLPALTAIVIDLVEAVAQTGALDRGDRGRNMGLRLEHLRQMLVESGSMDHAAMCSRAIGSIRNNPHIKRLSE